jgi:hypothetical protein
MIAVARAEEVLTTSIVICGLDAELVGRSGRSFCSPSNDCDFVDM